MARLALGLIGAVIAGPAGLKIGAGLGFSIGSAIGALLFPGPGQTIEGPRLTDLRVQTSSFGEPIVEPYGTLIISGNVIWATDIQEVRTESSSSGKGGPSVTTVSYTYFGNFAVGLSTAVESILRIWADGKLIYDATDGNEGPISRFASNIRIYTGNETQLPDSAIESDKGSGNVPGHRGMAYVVLDRLPLEDFANHIPNIACEVTTNVTGAFPFVEVETGNHDAKGRMFQSHDGRFVYTANSGGPTFEKIDAINNRHLGSFDLPPPIEGWTGKGPMAMDSDGNIFAWWGLSFNGRMVKYAAPNYNIEFISINNGLNAALLLPGGSAQAPVVYGVRDAVNGSSLYVMSGALGEPAPVIANLDLKTLYDAGGGIWLDTDEDGNCWAGYKNTGADPDRISYFLIDRFGNALKVKQYEVSALDGAGVFLYFPDEGAEGRFLIDVAGDLVKWDIATDAEIARLAGIVSGSNVNDSAFRQGVIDGHIYLLGSDLVRKIDVSTMTVAAVWDPDDWVNLTWVGFVYDKHSHALWGQDNFAPSGLHKLLLDRESSGTVTLQSIVDDRLAKAGLVPADTDTSALAGEVVRGYAVTGRMAERKALEPLAQAFFWDLVESDFKLKAVVRGGASVASIPEGDLAAHEFAAEPPAELIETRAQEISLPERVDLTYINPATNYETGTQHARRIAEGVSTRRSITMDLPIVLSDDEAKQIVERMLFLFWLERESFEISLSQKWLNLDPADVVTVTEDGVSRNLLIKQIDDGANLIRRISTVADDDIIYQSTATGAASDIPTGTLILPGPTEFELIDSPLFRDGDDGPGFYIAATGYGDAWPGCVIYVSDDAVTWTALLFIGSGAGAVMGRANGALADGPTTVFDEVNSINISLINGTLTSATRAQVLDGANACMIGDEILQYRDATQESDGSWTLSGLLRGRRGTEWATHAEGDRFVTLELGKLSRVGTELANIGQAKFYRAVTLSDPIEGAGTRSFTNTGRALMPLSGVDLRASRNSGGDITFTWKRRTRIGGPWRDFVDVPLGQTSENYDLVVMDGATEVRTISVTSETASYSSTDQGADFGSDQSAVLINLYQMSEDAGRGFAATATL